MVKTPTNAPKAKAKAASAGGVARPSQANASSPGSAKMSKFKKRKANGAPAKVAAAAVVVADGATSASVLKPSAASEASPVASLRPATAAEGPSAAQAPKADIAEASAPKPKPADAAAATSNGVGASGGDARKKNKRERKKEKTMAWKGKGKEEEAQAQAQGKKGNWKEERGKKEVGGDSRGGGLIFMCNAQTKPECFQNRVFGMPMGKKEMVEKVRPGMKLFLYDFDLRLLYGVYKASSKGGLDLVQNAFNGKFPAQVKFKTDKDCLPLPESSFKHAIKENYSASRKFDPELNSTQVRRLMDLFKPINVPQSAPEERHRHAERRHLHQYEDRLHVLPIEERRQQVVVHVPAPEDSYRATRFAPFPTESGHGQLLTRGQDDHIYYQQALPAPESRHAPLAPESRHAPLAPESRHVPIVPEPRHVPSAYYHHLAPSSDDSYYRSRVDPVHERIAARTPPRDYTSQPGGLNARADRLEESYRTGNIVVRGARLEDPYRPREIDARGARVEDLYRPGEVASRGARLEDPYRPREVDARGARVEDLYRPGEIASRGARVEDLYLPGEIASRGARVEDLYHPGEIAARGARVEDLYRPGEIAARGAYGELYRSDRVVTRAVDPPHPYETSSHAYAETSQIPGSTTRANGPGVPVSSLYSFAGAPVYR
uniref:Uncharacterized protein n=2 Tax=Avena sativa TaxID=4498 RepID=A0ACD5VCL7_AVESA